MTSPTFFAEDFGADIPEKYGGALAADKKPKGKKKKKGQPTVGAAATPAATPQWLPMTSLDYVSFYGSPSPALSACSNPQWVCYGDYVLLKMPNYSQDGQWYGPWWTVHSCNFVAQLNICHTSVADCTASPSHYAAWNSYGVFLTPYYYSGGGYDHLRTSMAVMQLVPYGTASTPCSPGTSPMCSSNPLYGQPICSGDTVYLQWNMLCTHNNPTYCEAPYCWGNVAGNAARLAWYSDDGYPNVTWPLYVSQDYQFDSSGNTTSGNSCISYDMPQLLQLTSYDSSNPNNQVYMNNSSWTNDKYTLWTITGTGKSNGENLSYGDSVTFGAHDNTGYNVVAQPFAVQNAMNTNTYAKALPRQFTQQLVIDKANGTDFQIMPATNPLATTSPVQQLFCFESPGKCTGTKPKCLTGSPGCVGGKWECLGTIYQGCSCPLTKCDATGLCLTPAGEQPTKTVSASGQCTFTCSKGINPYLYFVLPAILVILFLFFFFVL